MSPGKAPPAMTVLALLALGAGCHNATTPSAAPPERPVIVSTSYYLGTPLSVPGQMPCRRG